MHLSTTIACYSFFFPLSTEGKEDSLMVEIQKDYIAIHEAL
jgi:hypothetical protein